MKGRSRLFAAAAALAGCRLLAQSPVAGIHAITADELQQTRTRCENSLDGAPVASAFAIRAFLMRTGVLRMEMFQPPQSLDTVTRMAASAPFNVVIMGPTGQACLAASEAKRKFLPFTTTPEQVNLGVIVDVKPSNNFTAADSVERVVLKHGETVIQPSAQQLNKVTVQNGFGASKELATGTFGFKIADFAPEAAPVTMVVIGTARNFEWTFSKAELEYMY